MPNDKAAAKLAERVDQLSQGPILKRWASESDPGGCGIAGDA